MHRCLELATRGTGYVSPNPMVGAVLVYQSRIIGEGYHQQYGQAHAEVNCINSVKGSDRQLINKSTLYVSLEPCAHFGKTPPCADFIIRHKIPRVIIGCRDPFKEVNGKGIEKLNAAGIDTELGVLEDECRQTNRRFFLFHTRHLPYIVLKWAQTADGMISTGNEKRLLISNAYSNRLVHKWRSEEMAILVGTNTALMDNPELTTRLWAGQSPVRLIMDMNLRLPASLKIFNTAARTIIFNSIKHQEQENLLYYQLDRGYNVIHQMMKALYLLNIHSVLVEGGAKLLQSFIDERLWDEARIITGASAGAANYLPAPKLVNAKKKNERTLVNDKVEYFNPVVDPDFTNE